MEDPQMNDNDVLVQRTGHLGHLVLNRPQAMNALNHGMVLAVAAALDAWEKDDAVATVLISGAGGRGLCAGGDIVSIYHDARTGGHQSEQFWRDEYHLNARIKRYPKPVVAFMDGVVLGGGVGISAHASHRVVTERSRIGMPETGIGFVPDVGGTYLLSRAPGELGTHAGLTGSMVSGADAIAMGLADYFLDSSLLPTLAAELAERNASSAVARHGQEPPESALINARDWIDAAYSAADAGAIVKRLAGSGVPEAEKAAATILAKSPTAVTVTLEALRRARALGSLEEVLDQELRVSLRALRWPDFAEGIRAQLVDKDRNPAWQPAALADVPAAVVESIFEDLGPDELGLANARNGSVAVQ
ncbi:MULTISPECIES: enoyl-CoA hydratase/isomerase family protein [unclassified Arthrobacter]|uniref:enoyl-CoA hydratase/isomerase family protein n=1 Tax=unclassified Arthrobacter TaxID=235627 RepID=UPI00159E1120|nr:MULTISPECIES: enoyl-CoA hydratase/isomerase family protein [unclassified Arthrobacter]MCQ9163094.1 enoyl-CoA hydratase/isomerase family protein [Arthrobacter sp. STN4]NVM97549.1 enoyl-CoA hydratase/isomerase family protein [Arthrobacter sp. SDTb3-6]